MVPDIHLAVVAVCAIAGAVVVPHLLPLDRAAPVPAAIVWFCGLSARVLAAVTGAVAAVFYLPAPLVAQIGHWCVSVPIPGGSGEMQVVITGHEIAQVIALVPAAIVVVSAFVAVRHSARDAARVRRLLRDEVLWTGPGGASVIGGSSVVVAAAGISRPQLLISAGALVALDDDELAASLDHERGHITRRHRYVVVAVEIFATVAHLIPGTARARLETLHHLERDADQWSLGRAHDPAALARAICKAALEPVQSPAITGLASGRTVRRVEALLRPDAGIVARRRSITAVAAALVAASLIAASAVPATAASGVHQLTQHQPERHCVN